MFSSSELFDSIIMISEINYASCLKALFFIKCLNNKFNNLWLVIKLILNWNKGIPSFAGFNKSSKSKMSFSLSISDRFPKIIRDMKLF